VANNLFRQQNRCPGNNLPVLVIGRYQNHAFTRISISLEPSSGTASGDLLSTGEFDGVASDAVGVGVGSGVSGGTVLA